MHPTFDIVTMTRSRISKITLSNFFLNKRNLMKIAKLIAEAIEARTTPMIIIIFT